MLLNGCKPLRQTWHAPAPRMSTCHLLCFSSKPIDDMLRSFANVCIFMRQGGTERVEERGIGRGGRVEEGCSCIIPKLSGIFQMQRKT